jgi:hypothetical protein
MSSAGSCLFTSVNTVTILIGQGGIVLLMRCGLYLGKQCCGAVRGLTSTRNLCSIRSL